MSFKSLWHYPKGILPAILKLPGKVPLSTVLIVPFVVQIFATVGVVGYLSFKNGQEAVNDVASKLRGEVGDRINQYLQTLITTPRAIEQMNADAVYLGQLNLQDLTSVERYLIRQIQLFKSVTYIQFGTENGEFVGVERSSNGKLNLEIAGKFSGNALLTYRIDERENRTKLLKTTPNYDPRIRPWYVASVKARNFAWSKIYISFGSEQLSITQGLPLYDSRGTLLGVTAVDLSLSQIGEFLRSIKVGRAGQIFIIDRSGMLVATSTDTPIFSLQKNQIEQLKATDSSNRLTRATAKYLNSQFKDLNQIQTSPKLEFEFEGKRQFLQVLPFQDDRGLNWLVVVVVPEADFMEQIEANTRTTILLCVTALIVATLVGIITARWITQPILRLNAAATALSKGELYRQLETKRHDELGNLILAFNQMAAQLQESFTALEEAKQELEIRVEQRTASLRESEEKFAKVFRSSPWSITITNKSDGRHIDVNDSFCSMTGYTPKEVIDRTAVELNLWANPEERFRLFEKLENGDSIQNYEFSFRTKSGEVKTAILSTEIINISGRECLLALSSDISDRKLAEEALRQAKEAADAANKAKSDFLANMSHELRTPLNAILGFTQLMNRATNLTPDQQENLGIISRSGEHLLSLINQVLDLSKIEAGRMTLNEGNFDLYCLLDDLEDMFGLKADDKNLHLLFERTSDVPQYVRTDEVKLRQVLINLLNNAVKFTREGGVTLRVKMADIASLSTFNNRLTTINSKRLLFELEDTGSGIAPDELNNLFEAFVQTKTGKASQQGTGLGLAISRSFVKLMGGNISVNSEIDKGTLFKFDIAFGVVDAADIKTKQPSRRVIALAPEQPRYRILIVDDRSENRYLLLKLLQPLGFDLKEASNGLEAIEIWFSWQPHLIWMDMRMPVMDGYEATKQIKTHTKGQATAIIALTASVFEEEKAIVLSAGCDDFLRKPFREAEIFDAMQKHLGVHYIYDEMARYPGENLTELEQKNSLTAAAFAALPAELLSKLEEALMQIDMEEIDSYINQTNQYNPALASGMTALASDFKYDEILNLIHESKKISGIK